MTILNYTLSCTLAMELDCELALLHECGGLGLLPSSCRREPMWPCLFLLSYASVYLGTRELPILHTACGLIGSFFIRCTRRDTS